MTRRKSDSWANRHGEWRPAIGLGSLIIIAPQLLGGAPAWATLVIAVLATIVLALVLIYVRLREHEGLPKSWDAVTLALAAALGVTVLHALPLPAALAKAIGLDSYEHAEQTALGLGLDAPQWISFTLDPAGTHERILYGIAVFTAFLAVRIFATSSGGSNTVLRLVAISAILVGLAHATHMLFEATRVYGLYRPVHARPLGPLLNPNNLAGFMALAFPVCIGLALSGSQALKWAWLLGATVVAATALLSRSRGGLGALLASCVLFAYLRLSSAGLRRDSRRTGRAAEHPPLATRSWQAVLLVILVVGIAFGLAALAADQFVDSDYRNVSKIELIHAELQALRSTPLVALFGAGRGAFSTFLSGHYGPGRAVHAENLPLQYAIEYGIPLTIALLAVVVWVIAPALWRVSSAAKLGGLVGVVVLVLQNFVDLGLELTGIAVPAAACLAASLPLHRDRAQSAPPRFDLNDVGVFGAAVSVLLIAVVGPSALANDTMPLLFRLKEQLQAHDYSAFRKDLERGATAHPADPAFAVLAASESVIRHRRDAPFWLNRSMLLAPYWSAPHLWAANWLASHGRNDQAVLELGIAAELDPFVALRDVCEWLKHHPSGEVVLAIAPQREPARSQVLDAGAKCLYSLPGETQKVDKVLLTADPHHVGATLRVMRRDLANRDYQAVLKRGRALRGRAPHLAEPHRLEAEALSALGRTEQAVSLLTAASTHVDDRSSVLTALAQMQTRNHDAEGMRSSIERLRMEASGRTTSLANAAALLGTFERQLGNDARALKAMREAYDLHADTRYLASAANLAAKLGQLEYALSAWRQLCGEKKPEAQDYCRKRDALVEKALHR